MMSNKKNNWVLFACSPILFFFQKIIEKDQKTKFISIIIVFLSILTFIYALSRIIN